jgi:hypothetical protein
MPGVKCVTPEPFTLWDLLKWLASALGALALWMARMFHKRLDDHDVSHSQLVEKVRELELNTISRPTFQRHEADIKDSFDTMRREATGREDRIVGAINRLEGRIDKFLEERLFVSLLPKLISYAYAMGYELTLGDGYRDPRAFGAIGETKGYGHSKSGHKQRLAVDFNLFKEGVFLPDTASHAFLGDYWERLHPLCRWGGKFADGNHYSMERDGIK